MPNQGFLVSLRIKSIHASATQTTQGFHLGRRTQRSDLFSVKVQAVDISELLEISQVGKWNDSKSAQVADELLLPWSPPAIGCFSCQCGAVSSARVKVAKGVRLASDSWILGIMPNPASWGLPKNAKRQLAYGFSLTIWCQFYVRR